MTSRPARASPAHGAVNGLRPRRGLGRRWDPPPTAPPLTLTDGTPPTVARDDLGLGLGGIRLAQQEAPVRINSGLNSGPGLLPRWQLSPGRRRDPSPVVPGRADLCRRGGHGHCGRGRVRPPPPRLRAGPCLVHRRGRAGRGTHSRRPVEAGAAGRIVERIERAAAAADAGDLQAARRWMRQADVFADRQLRGTRTPSRRCRVPPQR